MITIHKPKMVKLGKLNPQAYNPRRISAAKFAALKQSITDNGFVDALTVQLDGMGIIAGHQRRRAMYELEGEKRAAGIPIPCYVLDIDDAKAKLLNIALNNTEGENDPDKLAAVINSIVNKVPLDSVAWRATGLTQSEIANLVQPPVLPDDGGKPFAASVTLSIGFDSVAERDAVKGLLAERATTEGKKAGTIVRELLEGTSGGKRRK